MRSLFVALAVLLCMIGTVFAVLMSDAAMRKQFESARQEFIRATTQPSEMARSEAPAADGPGSSEPRTVAEAASQRSSDSPISQTASTVDTGSGETTKPATGLGAAQSSAAGLKLDIARIGRNGVSVFAGRAAPFQRVRVQMGDTLLGGAQADAEGNWALVTEQPIADPDAKVQVSAGAAEDAAGGARQHAKPNGELKVGEVRPVANVNEVNRQIISTLEGLVEEARETAAEVKPATATQVARVATDSVTDASPQLRVRKIPIPIQFVFRESRFTEEGNEAVRLLMEYLRVSKPEVVRLSGHADERGSQELNLALSKSRLEAVRDYLKESGFSGRFVLEPKGESEPFSGVDRSGLDPEALFQLDRRVELILEE